MDLVMHVLGELKWDWWYLAPQCTLDYFDLPELFALMFWLIEANGPN